MGARWRVLLLGFGTVVLLAGAAPAEAQAPPESRPAKLLAADPQFHLILFGFGGQLILAKSGDIYNFASYVEFTRLFLNANANEARTGGLRFNSARPGGAVASKQMFGSVVVAGTVGRESGLTEQILAGPRITSIQNPRLAIYVHVLAGITHYPNETVFTLAPGGGVRLPLNARFNLTFDIGLPVLFFNGAAETGFSAGGGLVCQLGGR